MKKKQDITTSEDIKLMVDSFYDTVRSDDIIGYIFNDVAKTNWEMHLPRMYSFWESILLGKATFEGNPMTVHMHLNKKEKLTSEHFDQWTKLWTNNIDELFQGPKAAEAKQRALSIRSIMEFKVRQGDEIIDY